MSSRVFTKGEWLGDVDGEIQVHIVSGNYITIISKFHPNADWLSWFEDQGYFFVSLCNMVGNGGTKHNWPGMFILNLRKQR